MTIEFVSLIWIMDDLMHQTPLQSVVFDAVQSAISRALESIKEMGVDDYESNKKSFLGNVIYLFRNHFNIPDSSVNIYINLGGFV